MKSPIGDLEYIAKRGYGSSTIVSKTGGSTIQMRGRVFKYALVLVDGKHLNMRAGFDSNGFDFMSFKDKK